ncbi:unnamed protein product [Boreogadus saida]
MGGHAGPPSQQPSRPTSLLPTDWTSALGLGKEEDPLPPGLEALPLRLMQQDCTSVKTLLLRLRRTLQESTETSPASSLQSLPISPCSEKSLPLKSCCSASHSTDCHRVYVKFKSLMLARRCNDRARHPPTHITSLIRAYVPTQPSEAH